jgi:hypothetical protein
MHHSRVDPVTLAFHQSRLHRLTTAGKISLLIAATTGVISVEISGEIEAPLLLPARDCPRLYRTPKSTPTSQTTPTDQIVAVLHHQGEATICLQEERTITEELISHHRSMIDSGTTMADQALDHPTQA